MAIKHPASVGKIDIHMIDPAAIQVQDGWNPRKIWGGDEDEELKASIKENGVLQPITVKRVGDDLLLIDGERRLRATLAANEEGAAITGIPCRFQRKTMSDSDALILALLSNTGKPLDPVEEAEAFGRLKAWGMNPDDIAKKMGKSRAHVYNQLKLGDAGPKLKAAVQKGDVDVKVARQIVTESNGDLKTQATLTKKAKEEKKARKAARKAPKVTQPGGNGDSAPPSTPATPKIKPVNREMAQELLERFTGLVGGKFKSEVQKHRFEGVLIGMTMLLDGCEFTKAKEVLKLEG